MSSFTFFTRAFRSASIITLSVFFLFSVTSAAQTSDEAATERQRALQLFGESKFIEAIPLLEKLAAANPSDAVVQEQLGFSLFVKAQMLKDAGERQKTRELARAALRRAQASAITAIS